MWGMTPPPAMVACRCKEGAKVSIELEKFEKSTSYVPFTNWRGKLLALCSRGIDQAWPNFGLFGAMDAHGPSFAVGDRSCRADLPCEGNHTRGGQHTPKKRHVLKRPQHRWSQTLGRLSCCIRAQLSKIGSICPISRSVNRPF
eukprot:1149143-Pelagomonas_calceolata.AAC.9